jgi:hypothetical protein
MAETFMDVPIETFRLFAQYLADHNLWDEVEQALKSQGQAQIRMSFDPTKTIARLLKQRAAADTKPGQPQHPIAMCKCGVPVVPVDGDGGKTPEPPEGGSGPPDGGLA